MPNSTKKIKNYDSFKELVKDRTKFSWTLTAIIFLSYFCFILLIAFNPTFLATKIGNSQISLGIPIAISLIFLTFLLTGAYVSRANTKYDKLIDDIEQQLLNDDK